MTPPDNRSWGGRTPTTSRARLWTSPPPGLHHTSASVPSMGTSNKINNRTGKEGLVQSTCTLWLHLSWRWPVTRFPSLASLYHRQPRRRALAWPASWGRTRPGPGEPQAAGEGGASLVLGAQEAARLQPLPPGLFPVPKGLSHHCQMTSQVPRVTWDPTPGLCTFHPTHGTLWRTRGLSSPILTPACSAGVSSEVPVPALHAPCAPIPRRGLPGDQRRQRCVFPFLLSPWFLLSLQGHTPAGQLLPGRGRREKEADFGC